MMKKGCVILFTLILVVVSVGILFSEDAKALPPGPPMILYGTIKDYAGASITDGIPVCAYVVDPVNQTAPNWFNYSSGNGGYGNPYTGVIFNINDTEQGRFGYTVYLYVGQLNVTSFTFDPGTTEKNLTIADDPTVLSNNSDVEGYTGDPFEVNVTVREYK